MDAKAEQVDAYIKMFESRVARTNGGDAPGVEEEELEEYPILPGTSKMIYFSDACSEKDFPGFRKRLDQWERWCTKGLVDTSNPNVDRAPFALNFGEICNVYCIQEREWEAQVRFTETVLQHASFDILSYWYQNSPMGRTLDTLCSRSGMALMLTRKVDARLPWQHHYDQLSDVNSPFNTKARSFTREIQPIPEMRPVKMELSCIYMLDFTPMDVFKVRKMYPRCRIVGICTPSPNVDGEVLKVLKIQAGLMNRKRNNDNKEAPHK